MAFSIVEYHVTEKTISAIAFATPQSIGDRRPGARLKAPNPKNPPLTGENALHPILKTLQQIQSDMAKTNDRVSSMETRLQQPSRFTPSLPTCDDQISLMALSYNELEDGLSLALKLQQQMSVLLRKKVLANINKDKISLAEQPLPNAKRFLFREDFPTVASKPAELSRGLAKTLSHAQKLKRTF